MTETHEQRVERLARAVCVADGLYDGNDDGGEVFDTDPDLREAYRRSPAPSSPPTARPGW